MAMNIKQEVEQIVDKVHYEAESRAFRAATELRNTALTVLKGERSGKVYRKPYTKTATYRASAPGEPPAVRSGNLRQSWRQRTASEEAGGSLTIMPAITTDVKYAPWLDEGTGKMAPRPFEEPIIEAAKPKIKQIYSEPYLNKLRKEESHAVN